MELWLAERKARALKCQPLPVLNMCCSHNKLLYMKAVIKKSGVMESQARDSECLVTCATKTPIYNYYGIIVTSPSWCTHLSN